MPDGRRCSPRRPRSRRAWSDALEQRRQARVRAAVVGDLEDVHRLRRSGSNTWDSASAVSSIEIPSASSRVTSALSFGSPLARQPGGRCGGHRTWKVRRPSVIVSPCAGAWRLAGPRRSARWMGESQPAPPSTTKRGRCARSPARAAPSWSDSAWVSISASSRPIPACLRRARIGPSGTPVSTSTLVAVELDQRRVALADVEERDAQHAGRGGAAPRCACATVATVTAAVSASASRRRAACDACAGGDAARRGAGVRRRPASAAHASEDDGRRRLEVDRRERQTGRVVRDLLDVDEQRAGQRGERRRQRGRDLSGGGASTPSHITGAIAGRRQQVRRQRRERHLLEVQRHQRCRPERRGGRDRRHVGHRPGHAPGERRAQRLRAREQRRHGHERQLPPRLLRRARIQRERDRGRQQEPIPAPCRAAPPRPRRARRSPSPRRAGSTARRRSSGTYSAITTPPRATSRAGYGTPTSAHAASTSTTSSITFCPDTARMCASPEPGSRP